MEQKHYIIGGGLEGRARLDAAVKRTSPNDIKSRLADSDLQPASIMAFDLAGSQAINIPPLRG